jgi:hypothetical protein
MQVDPFHYDLRTGLAAAQQGVLADLLSGVLSVMKYYVRCLTADLDQRLVRGLAC